MEWLEEDEEEVETTLLRRLEDSEVIADLSPRQRSQALVIATRQQRSGLAQSLLEHGANPNEEDEFGCTAVMFAATHGLVDCLQCMLNRPHCAINKRSHSQQTALHFAAKRGQVACIKILLRFGAMKNVSDDWGETPLLLAVRGGSLDAVEVMLSEGARLDTTNLRGMDALMYAAQGGHTGILELLLKQTGCDVNRVLKSSPLHQAAVYGHVECVRILVSHGARSDIRDVHGMLPIELATNTDKHEVVELLLQEGTTDEYKNLALAAAAKSNGIRSVQTLLEWNVAPGAVDMQGLPAFFWAVAQNNKEIVLSFIRHNIDINKTLSRVYLVNSDLRELTLELDLDFVTAVVIAAFRDYRELVQILVQAGAQVDAVLRLWEQNLLPVNLSSDTSLVSWLAHHATTPRPLVCICRQHIRRNLSNKAFKQITTLPLPRPIQDFLQFSDLEHI